MKTTTLVLAFCLAVSLRAAPVPAFALHDGDRVVFYGDSITSDGGYARLAEAYARTRFPSWNLRFYNAGVGGDTVGGGGAGDIKVRLERDLISLNPTVVTIMLGMNDGHYRPLDAETLATYSVGYHAIVERVKKELPLARIFVIRPSPFDDISRLPDFEPGYDDVIRRLGETVLKIATEEHCESVDLWTPVDEGIRSVWRTDRELSRQIVPDRVHPSFSGHWLMAAALLRAWHAPALVSRVAIDLKEPAAAIAENASVSDLGWHDERLEWTQKESCVPLPVKFENADIDLANKALADIAGLDDESLKITGLQGGYYELRIDEQGIGRFSNEELLKGINLARYDTPMRLQAYKVLWGVEGGHQMQKVRRQLLVSAVNDPSLVPAAQALAAKDEADQAARSRLAEPLERRFSLERVP